ncbi:MAG: glycoside hydrolase family 26 protein [Thermoleophilia bacterium]
MNTLAWRRAVLAILIVAAVGAVIAVPFLQGGDGGASTGTAPGATAPATPAVPAVPAGTPMQRLLPPERGVYFGVSGPALPRVRGAIPRWAASHGVRPRIIGWFQQWLSGERAFRTDWALRIAEAGAVPMVTWEPWYAPAGQVHTPDQPRVRLARIAAGDFDPLIRRFARQVAAYKGPVLLRLMHEMNGNWYPWGILANGNSPRDYVRAWRHVHDLFRDEGARNVSWVWSINNLEGPASEDRQIVRYYPGARYVDWVSTSGFNWGDAYRWSSWRDADALYGGTYRALSRFGKPIMISEIGTTGIGGTPLTWIRQTMVRLRTGYPKLRAVVWYDDVDARGLDFRLRGPTLRALAGPAVVGRGWLRAPRIATLPD